VDALDWTAKWADYTPEKVAIKSYDSNESYTYSDLNNYADRLINKFVALNLEEGDRIAVLAEHSLEYIVLFVACQRIGIIIVPLNYRLPVNEIAKLIIDCTPSLLIYNSNNEDKLEQLNLDALNIINFSSLKEHYQKPTNSVVKTYSIKADNPLFIFYTSGTTGTPKGVIYTNNMLFWNSLNTSMQLGHNRHSKRSYLH